MMHMKKIFYIALTLGCLACSKDYIPDAEVRELAVIKDEYVFGTDASECVVPVFSNGTVQLSFLEEAQDWVTLDRKQITGDGSVAVKVAANKEGAPRMATLILSLVGKELKDTVVIKQQGHRQHIECLDMYKVVSGQGGELECGVRLENIPSNGLEVDIQYSDYKGGWISRCVVEDNLVKVSLDANQTSLVRRAAVTVYYIDAWKRRIEATVYLTQSDSDGVLGTDISPMEVRLLADKDGFKVNDDYVLEGIVVSDCSSRNMELNPLLDYNVLDSLASLRTAYLQPEAGPGFKLVFDQVKDNTLTFGTRVKLNLYDCTLSLEADPDRYVISGLTGANLLETSQAAVPQKTKKISELTDDDIYTYVTLTDTEFSCTKGTYLDIAEHASYSFMDGWASLLIDNQGRGIYAPVNVNCSWRRTGEGLPQGSGSTSGIIVSHKMPRLGDAGRYQIRVLDKSGFGQSDDAQTTGWMTHAEWFNSVNKAASYAKVNERYAEPAKAEDHKVIVPSVDILTKQAGELANGEYICENATPRPGGNTYASGVYYIRKDNTSNGDTAEGVAWLNSNKGWYEWENGAIKDYKGFVFTFNNLPSAATDWLFVFDFCFGNLNSYVYAHTHPAHWCLEYWDTQSDCWTLVQKDAHMFTDPDERNYVHMKALPWPSSFVSGRQCYTGAETGMGFTRHSYLLPAGACDAEQGIKLRLRPYDDHLVRLTSNYLENSEDYHVSPDTDISGGLRLRFGTIALKYR
jgi:hypothetical protein